MINKFPKLSEDDRDALKKWLKLESHLALADYHSYEACGNESEALKSKYRSGCFSNIIMMMKYHSEES